jgi:hypothetical protein
MATRIITRSRAAATSALGRRTLTEQSGTPPTRIPRPVSRNSRTQSTPPDEPDDDPDDGSNHSDDGSGDPDDPPDDNNTVRSSRSRPDPDYDALVRLVTAAREPQPKVKVREPEAFDGTDSRKLRSFLVLCNLNFRARARSYNNDEAKVNYALSYLKGTALDWFEPAITEETYEAWMDSWPEFVRILKRNFGPADPVGDAEDEIVILRMKDNQRIAKYNVDFNRLAALTRWPDAPLRHAYYRGLPARIKDILAHTERATTLDALRNSAQQIDIRYWERRAEISREQPQQQKKSESSASDKSKSDNKKSSGNSGNSGSNNSSNNNNNNKSSSSSDKKSDKSNQKASGSSANTSISDLLDKDGKLKPQERQRRIDNKLCLRCGKPNHMAKDCKVGESKARAAKPSEEKSPEESKK